MTLSKTRPITDIPDKLIRSCVKKHWDFTVGFVRVEKSNRVENVILLGSGVLVTIKDIPLILTADHVLDILPRTGRLGLVLSDKLEQTTIDVTGIEYVSIGRGDDSGRGPDIGAVLLSEPTASMLRARKSFYNLDLRKERLLGNPPDDHQGIWIAQGFVEEMTVLDSNPSPFESVKGFCQFGAIGGVENYISSGGYDYYNFPLTNASTEGIPRSFGGCSGGGLWHVLLKETKGGELAVDQSLLQGLLYWQDPPQKGLSALKCHGPKSIYDVAYSKIRQHASSH